jgi:hypothetical protein
MYTEYLSGSLVCALVLGFSCVCVIAKSFPAKWAKTLSPNEMMREVCMSQRPGRSVWLEWRDTRRVRVNVLNRSAFWQET